MRLVVVFLSFGLLLGDCNKMSSIAEFSAEYDVSIEFEDPVELPEFVTIVVFPPNEVVAFDGEPLLSRGGVYELGFVSWYNG